MKSTKLKKLFKKSPQKKVAVEKLEHKKHIAIGIIIVVALFVIIFMAIAYSSFDIQRHTEFGITFSKKFANQLELDWKRTYIAMLDDLDVKYIRIPTYWEEVEPKNGTYKFADIDWQLQEALKRDVKVTLTLGRRQPRWPECHDPQWVHELDEEQSRSQLLQFIETVVRRYRTHEAIEIWQVENEPFLVLFGECPKLSQGQLQEEIDLVRSLDDRPILVSDSGELSSWYPPILMGDYFGTTVYRRVWNKYIGDWYYWFVPPSYYGVKAVLWNKPLENTWVSEMQAEPWFPNNPLETPLEGHYKTMDAKKLKDNITYSRTINFGRVYLWGVEWWYWMKTTQNDGSLWETAKTAF